MRRIRLPLGRRLFVLVATLAALIAMLPLRLVAGALGLPALSVSARAAEGSLWSGRLVEARVSGVPLGDLRTTLRVLPLLAGRARIDVRGGGDVAQAADAMRAGVTISRHVLALDDATLRLPIGRLLAPLPVREIMLTDVTARFRGGICETAEGNVRAELGAIGGAALSGGYSGAPRCDGGALLLPLTSASGDRLTLRLLGGGAYRADVSVRPGDPAAAARLTASGFAPAPDGSLTLGVDGRW